MSLSDLDVKALYNANGVTVNFAIPFANILNDSVETFVYKVDESVNPATETLQTEGALQDYTLTGASPPGTPFDTHVTFNTAPASGLKIMVVRRLALTQPEDLDATSTVNLTTLERALDRVTALIQQLDEAIKRGPKFRQSYTALTDPLLPDPSANQFLKWNSSANGLTNATPVLNSDSGAVGSPGSSTDNALVRWDGTDASTIQNSAVTVNDSGDVDGVRNLNVDGDLQLNDIAALAVLVTDANKIVATSAVTLTEFDRLTGVTSNIQGQLNDLDDRITDLENAPAPGGGSVALRWYSPDTQGAPKFAQANGLEGHVFDNSDPQFLFCKFTVPESYVAGTQMFLKKGKFFTSSTSGKFKPKVTSYIFKANIDGTSTPTGYNSTNAEETADATTNEIVVIGNIDITNASGQINSVSVAPGDTILLKLTRDWSNESSPITADVKILTDEFELDLTA